MSTAAPLQTLAAKPRPLSNSTHAGLLLKRKCACGAPTASLTGECAECKSGKRLQTNLVIGASNDPLEQEADRVADQVLAAQANPAVSGAPPHIQRYTGQPSAAAGTAPASVDRVLASPGVPLATPLRREMEQRFGRDFSQVRIHADTEAARATRDVRARAWTIGRHIAFGPDRYAPESRAGRRLIAHELTHVVQQSASQAARVRDSFGTPYGDAQARLASAEVKTLSVPAGDNDTLQREVDDGSPPPQASPVEEVAPTDAAPAAPTDSVATEATPAQQAPVATAVPTLSVTPSAQLTRGDTLTATVAFTPRAGETMGVVAWRYTTPSHGSVTRATTEPDFQTRWSGAMALSGTVTLDYKVTPAGGGASVVGTLSQAVTVADRSGAAWTSTPDLRAENSYTGKPNPPVVFSDLGLHNATITNPTATANAVAAGANTGFSFVGSVTAGTYVSQPRIHPALSNTTSGFYTFHQNPSRLYFVVGATRNLVPLAAYSNLAVSGGTLTFDLPDWETFYKARHFYTVAATAPTGQGPVPVRDAWWGLASSSAAASLIARDAAAIRSALGIGASDAFNMSATPRGAWEGFQLMQSAAIQTGTQSHEYMHATHSHRANFTAMLRALDPRRKIEQTVSSPSNTVTFADKITAWVGEIQKPNHELVDETASRTAEAFVAVAGQGMAGVNTDPASGNSLGSVWNISGDAVMTN